MKKCKLLLILFICLFVIVGCGNNDTKTLKSSSNGDSNINDIDDLTSDKGTLSCSRSATASDGVTPSFNYEIEYNGDNILQLHSVEMVTSDDSSKLDEYESAYKKINTYYENLKYYDSNVIRTSNSVTRDTVINYDKINIDDLLEIEGEDDNIIEDGKAKLSIWLEFASKFGTECSET